VLPPGSTLLANGYFYGNVSVNETTTYSFTAEATDAEFQNTPKTFSIQIIKPSSIYYSYEFSGTNSFWIQSGGSSQGGLAADPEFSTSITGKEKWSAYNSPWTWETWIYPTVVPSGIATRKLIYKFKYSGYRDSMHAIWLWDDGMLQIDTGESGPYLSDQESTGSYTIPVNTWTHIALVKQSMGSGNFREMLYINGVRRRRTSDFNDYNMDYWPYANADVGADWGFTNGRDNNQSWGYIGLISNMRVTRNCAVYTGNFTVPTSPLTLTQSSGTNIAAITGDNDTGRVILLTCNDSSLKDNGYYDRTSRMIAKNGGPAFVATSPFG
jgi:hypothetical protein